MRKRKPLIDEDGEVRELLLEDFKRFRPIREVLSASSLRKLGIEVPDHPATNPEDPLSDKGHNKIGPDAQLVGAFGEKAAEAELLRKGWRTANFNSSIKNAADHDLIAVKGNRTVHLRVKTCGPAQDAFQFSAKPGQEMTTADLADGDYTILVRMGRVRRDDQFYVIPTRILREQINAHRRAFLNQPRRDGNSRKDLGHWTLRLQPTRSGEERPNYGFASKWKAYREAWETLEE
jgi:hypothetical protein